MDIHNIQGVQARRAAAEKLPSKAKKGPGVAKKGIVDVFEPSPDRDRAALLERIKSRVKSGYYSSGDVAEDLSSSFAKAFMRDF